uniref:Ribosomal RNA processing protein 1 B n=2 Tax=Lygus hesperus TaxID=30085 RepID=A0A0A9XI87_LYGHE
MDSKPSKEVLRVAQELSFARALASNDKTLRDRALKRLNKWFASMPRKKESFNEASFTRLWKGLYYCVWMSDKPLIQEECVDRICKLIHSLQNFKDFQKFVRCFFQCMSQAWFNLDSFRLDKFLMLIRRFLRQLLERLRLNDWNHKMVKEVIEHDLKPSYVNAPLGLNIHIAEIFLEELAKVGRGALSANVVFEFVKPFGEMLCETKDFRYMRTITNNVFFYLLRQSEEAIKHQAKFEAWRSTGFAGGEIDVMEEVSNEVEDEEDEDMMGGDDSDMEDDTPLDPRAGKVDVLLPPLEFDASQIIKLLAGLRKNPELSTKARKQIVLILNKFKTYQQGKYPLGIHKVELIEPEDEHEVIDKAAEKLASIEEELWKNSDVTGEKVKKKFKEPGNKGVVRKRKPSAWETTPLKSKKVAKASKSPGTEGSWTVIPAPDTRLKMTNGTKSPEFETNGFISTPMEASATNSSSPVISHTGIDSTPSADPVSSSRKQLLPVTTAVRSELAIKKRNKKKKRNSQQQELDSSWGDSAWESTTDEIEIPVSPIRNVSLGAEGIQTSMRTPLHNGHLGAVSGSGKKVEFVLNRNSSQEEEEYKMTLMKRPSIPYDALKKPPQSVLKQTPVSSPAVQMDWLPPSLAEIS